MKSIRAAGVIGAACASLGITACHARRTMASNGETAIAATEVILHGPVSVTGTGFDQRVVLVTGAGRRRLHASPADSAALVRAAGPTVELSVRGVEEGNDVRVRSFSVTSVGGVPVVDGIVRADGDHYWLDTPNGRVELGNPPQSLRGLVGARVWVQGPLDRGPNAYGVLVPRP